MTIPVPTAVSSEEPPEPPQHASAVGTGADRHLTLAGMTGAPTVAMIDADHVNRMNGPAAAIAGRSLLTPRVTDT